jgi:hypothetical protein
MYVLVSQVVAFPQVSPPKSWWMMVMMMMMMVMIMGALSTVWGTKICCEVMEKVGHLGISL